MTPSLPSSVVAPHCGAKHANEGRFVEVDTERVIDVLLGLLLTIGGFIVRSLFDQVRELQRESQTVTSAAREYAAITARIDRDRADVREALTDLKRTMESQHSALAQTMAKTDEQIFARLNEIADRLPQRAG